MGNPDLPTSVSASTTSDGTVTVTWNDVTGETGYNVYLCSTSYTGSWFDHISYSKSVGANTTSTVFTGIPGGSYEVYVVSQPNPNKNSYL